MHISKFEPIKSSSCKLNFKYVEVARKHKSKHKTLNVIAFKLQESGKPILEVLPLEMLHPKIWRPTQF
jgi:hypothetical protein